MSSITILMTLQNLAGVLTLAGAIIVVAVVIFVISSTSREEDKDAAKHKVYSVRTRYFFGLCLVLIVGLFISLRLLPYPRANAVADETVSIVGVQWFWKMANGERTTGPLEFVGSNEVTVPAKKNLKFVVTSADVNHSFGIYNSKGVLVTQTQAMPQYNNVLYHQFDEPGEYYVVCMEYCGQTHSYMVGKIHVQ